MDQKKEYNLNMTSRLALKLAQKASMESGSPNVAVIARQAPIRSKKKAVKKPIMPKVKAEIKQEPAEESNSDVDQKPVVYVKPEPSDNYGYNLRPRKLEPLNYNEESDDETTFRRKKKSKSDRANHRVTKDLGNSFSSSNAASDSRRIETKQEPPEDDDYDAPEQSGIVSSSEKGETSSSSSSIDARLLFHSTESIPFRAIETEDPSNSEVPSDKPGDHFSTPSFNRSARIRGEGRLPSSISYFITNESPEQSGEVSSSTPSTSYMPGRSTPTGTVQTQKKRIMHPNSLANLKSGGRRKRGKQVIQEEDPMDEHVNLRVESEQARLQQVQSEPVELKQVQSKQVQSTFLLESEQVQSEHRVQSVQIQSEFQVRSEHAESEQVLPPEEQSEQGESQLPVQSEHALSEFQVQSEHDQSTQVELEIVQSELPTEDHSPEEPDNYLTYRTPLDGNTGNSFLDYLMNDETHLNFSKADYAIPLDDDGNIMTKILPGIQSLSLHNPDTSSDNQIEQMDIDPVPEVHEPEDEGEGEIQQVYQNYQNVVGLPFIPQLQYHGLETEVRNNDGPEAREDLPEAKIETSSKENSHPYATPPTSDPGTSPGSSGNNSPGSQLEDSSSTPNFGKSSLDDERDAHVKQGDTSSNNQIEHMDTDPVPETTGSYDKEEEEKQQSDQSDLNAVVLTLSIPQLVSHGLETEVRNNDHPEARGDSPEVSVDASSKKNIQPYETPPTSGIGTSPGSIGNNSPRSQLDESSSTLNFGRSSIDDELDAHIQQGVSFLPGELQELCAGISRSNSRSCENQSACPVEIRQRKKSKRVEYENRDSNPASLHNTPPTDTRPEGDQQDQIMSSAPSSKRRNTNNSRCASLLLPSNASASTSTAAKNSEELDSDDDEMSSSGDLSELAKRPRTPRGRYSPDAQRKANSRFTLSALSIETHRNTDLNADGSGPSSSSAVSCSLSTPDPDRLSASQRRKGAPPPSVRPRKQRSPSVQHSQEEQTELDSDDEKDQFEIDSLPIVTDDPSYKITLEHKAIFKDVIRDVSKEYEFRKSELAELYRSTKTDQARLPEQIHIGNVIMKTWYGSPFPAEFINVKLLYICEFCFFFARSDQIMQNHSKKCVYRAPPGVEIYRKGDISVFEVDGRIQKSYCQTLCLISRMFLESKTVFYDTEPFFFYIVTINDEIGCRFAGYFSKEKYEPDVNNLSCIMTLPRYQDRGLGRFLIDVSYALSRREGWNGGPEQPLSDLGKKAYGGYWKMAIACSLAKFKDEIESEEGISIGDIASDTGINCHDILSVVCSMGWAKLTAVENTKIHRFDWDVDWEVVHEIENQKKRGHAMKIQFDEDYLDWVPRKMHPAMDGFQELSKEEIEQDEQRRRSLQKTPLQQTPSQESGGKATPVSLSKPIGSVKKELRSRGHNRSVGRNLMLELRNNIKVPETRDVTDDETKEKEKKKHQKKRKSFSRCDDESLPKDRHRDDSPDEDEQPGPSSRSSGRRHRSIREILEPTASTSEQSTSSGKGRYRKRSGGGSAKIEDSEGPTDEPASSEDEDERPFGAMNGHKGKNGKVQRGKKITKKRKSVTGKKFPPNFGVRSEIKEEREIDVDTAEKKKDTVDEQVKEEEVKPEVVKTDDESTKECNGEKLDVGMTTASEAEDIHPIEEEMERNYDIGTPESYHSATASPAPQNMDEQPPFVDEDCHYEDKDTEENKPPELISEVGNLSVSEPDRTLDDGPSELPPLAPSLADPAGYSSEDDDGPPRLSPQYGKVVEEDLVPEPAPMETEPHPSSIQRQQSQPQQLNGMHLDEPQTYHDPMSNGPSSSIHMTPQMMSNSQNMMNTTPQQHYSQPNSHQQATPGSGGIPSCGPVFNHSTPEQQSQQFMSPQMAGMPGSVSSVHSVHNNNSMEMVGGPSSLQHTPQQYDIGMGQMPSENGVMVNGMTPSMDQSNQMMIQQQQHGFSSPPMPVIPQPVPPQQPSHQIQQQVPPPTPAPPVVNPPATANARRRSESSTNRPGPRKQRQQSQAAAAPTIQPALAPPMNYNPMMMGHHYFAYQGYPYPHMAENGFYPYPNAYGYNMFNRMNPVDAAAYQQVWPQMAANPFNPGPMPNQNGAAAAAAAATNYHFPHQAAPAPFYQNNNS